MMGWGNGMGAGWLLMTLAWILILAVIVALVVRLFPGEVRRGRSAAPSPTAWDVLDHRLAGGEIDVQTYRALRHELAGTEPRRGDVRG